MSGSGEGWNVEGEGMRIEDVGGGDIFLLY